MAGKKFKIAICGGGIGGLVCALSLSKYSDIDVHLYESASQFGEIGAGIGIWPRVWKVLAALGLTDDLVEFTTMKPSEDLVHAFTFRKSDQSEGLDFYDMTTKGGMLTFHRADFQRVLLKHLPPSCRLSCSKRLESYHQRPSQEITLLFSDGSTDICDILIGADGIKSCVRRNMLTERARISASSGNFEEAERLVSSIDPIWTGLIAHRALIPVERLEEVAPESKILKSMKCPTMHLGKNANVVIYPVSQARYINIILFHAKHDLAYTRFQGPWVGTADNEKVLAPCLHWEPEVLKMLQCVDKWNQWAIHVVKPLESFFFGNVVIIGDAAHAMSPHQASGAGQAIEDAYILGTLLGHSSTTLQTVSKAFQAYDAIRRPFSTEIALRSFRNGQYFSLHYDGFDFNGCGVDVMKDKLQEMIDLAVEKWEWAWSTTVDESLEQAIKMLNN